MTEFETSVLQRLERIESHVCSLFYALENLFELLGQYFSIFFVPLLILIFSVLVLKWISRW